MRTMLLAAAAGLSLAASTAAYADSGDGPAANTLFTELPGVVAQADVPNASAYAQNRQMQPQQAQNGRASTSMSAAQIRAHGYSPRMETKAPTAS